MTGDEVAAVRRLLRHDAMGSAASAAWLSLTRDMPPWHRVAALQRLVNAAADAAADPDERAAYEDVAQAIASAAWPKRVD